MLHVIGAEHVVEYEPDKAAVASGQCNRDEALQCAGPDERHSDDGERCLICI